jgi:hypothetical protein
MYLDSEGRVTCEMGHGSVSLESMFNDGDSLKTKSKSVGSYNPLSCANVWNNVSEAQERIFYALLVLNLSILIFVGGSYFSFSYLAWLVI